MIKKNLGKKGQLLIIFVFLGYLIISGNELKDPRGVISSSDAEIFDVNAGQHGATCMGIWNSWETKLVKINCYSVYKRKTALCFFNYF